MSATEFTFKPIGHLKSCYPDKFGVPRQSGIVKQAYSELVILPEYQPEISLNGLQGYSHLWLQFVFHLNNSNKFHAKIHPPRLEGESVGVFSSRSPHRPNPIGLSLVEIVEVGKDRVILAGADLVDGTPILDIKPYLPHFENKPEARGGWAIDVANKDISVQFLPEAMEILQNWQRRIGRNELENVIVETLKQDPRPVIYRGYEASESPYRNKHAFRLFDGDIHFEFTDKNNVIVFDILF